eukprot:392305-Rhodomonas_salina.2
MARTSVRSVRTWEERLQSTILPRSYRFTTVKTDSAASQQPVTTCSPRRDHDRAAFPGRVRVSRALALSPS